MARPKKTFRFSLEILLKHRRMQEQEAKVQLALVRVELTTEQERLKNLESEKTAAITGRHALAAGGGTASSGLDQANQFLGLQDIRMERQKVVIAEVESRVEKCLEILRHKAMESKIVERLKEQRFDEFKIENRKLEQKEVDDMVTTRFAVRMTKGKS